MTTNDSVEAEGQVCSFRGRGAYIDRLSNKSGRVNNDKHLVTLTRSATAFATNIFLGHRQHDVHEGGEQQGLKHEHYHTRF